MADQPRRARNRPDSKQMWEESDRRNRHGANAFPRDAGKKNDRDRNRDRDRDRDRDRNQDREEGHRERDHRYRSRSRSPRRDRDRRDKHRDRRDRDRPRENERARPGRADDRPRGKGKDGARRDEERESWPRHRDVEDKGPARDRSPRRSASPPRSPGKFDGHTHNNSPLPTRPRPAGNATSAREGAGTSLSFKVGKHDSEGKGDDRARKGSSEEPEDGRRKRRDDTPMGDAMDEDEDGDGGEDDIVVEDDGLSAMQAMMGFGGFGTTKGAHVPGNNTGAVRKEKKIEYRQYMNRVGGFNRPLSPTR